MLITSFSILSKEAGLLLYATIAVAIKFTFNLTLALPRKVGSKYGVSGTMTIAGLITDSGTLLYVDAASPEKAVFRASRIDT